MATPTVEPVVTPGGEVRGYLVTVPMHVAHAVASTREEAQAVIREMSGRVVTSYEWGNTKRHGGESA